MKELELEISWKTATKKWKYIHTLTLTTKVVHMVLIGFILPTLACGYQLWSNHINRAESFSIINIVLYMYAYNPCFGFISKYYWTELLLLPMRKDRSEHFVCRHWNILTLSSSFYLYYSPDGMTVVHRSDHCFYAVTKYRLYGHRTQLWFF